MNAMTNRRALLGSIAFAAPVAVLAASSAISAAPVASADRSAWDASLAAHKAACAASETFHSKVYDPIRAAYDAAVKGVPHVTLTRHGRAVSTADEWEVKAARASIKSVRYLERCAWDDHKAEVALVDAADARDAKIAQIRKDSGLDAANDESERLSEASYEAFRAAVYTPVSSAALLQEKWAYMLKEDVLEGWEDAITADIARLVAREA